MNGAENFVITGGTLATPDGLLESGWLSISDGLISGIGTGTPPPWPAVAVGGALVVPGFVDIHCHGGGGVSFSGTDPGEMLAAVHAHRRHGTTTMLASLVSDPIRTLTSQIAALGELVADGEIAGIHLEGPFIARSKCGAHDPEVLLEPDDAALGALLKAGADTVRMVTLAPELPGGLRAVRRIAEAGIVPAIGHTEALETQVRAAVDAGARVATHLFNGMRPLHHREPGPVGALLDDERVTVELICDLVHLHPTVLRLAATHAGPDRTVLITDAMSATGAEDGRYRLGTLEVDVRDGVATLPGNGPLAGSTLTMDRAFRNLVRAAGLGLPEAVRACAGRPAELLGIADRTGALRPGLAADLVVLDDDLRPVRVMRNGAWFPETATPGSAVA